MLFIECKLVKFSKNMQNFLKTCKNIYVLLTFSEKKIRIYDYFVQISNNFTTIYQQTGLPLKFWEL